MKSHHSYNKILFILSIFTSLTVICCSKQEISTTPLASISIANMVVGGGKVQIGTYRNVLNPYGVGKYSFFAGDSRILASTVSTPTTVILDSNKTLKENGIYSLFLCGQGSTIEHIWVQENQPLRFKDSVFGVRFVNLSPNSNPLNITVSADTKTNLFYQLKYKEVPSIIKIPALISTPIAATTFQVRDATNESIITSIALSTPTVNAIRFKTVTIIVKGLQGTTVGTNAFGLILLTHY